MRCDSWITTTQTTTFTTTTITNNDGVQHSDHSNKDDDDDTIKSPVQHLQIRTTTQPTTLTNSHQVNTTTQQDYYSHLPVA